METYVTTTPFGRRPVTLGMLANQLSVQQAEPERTVDKWKLFRNLCIAKDKLGVSDRALAVLNALLSFHPGNDLVGGDGLVVFPSNVQLSLRTHGMAEQTIRRHVAVLVETGLVIRRDSPNGKRYARRNRTGSIGEAYGFCLSPLVARSVEIDQLAADAEEERMVLVRMKEGLSLLRRDVGKLIEAGLSENAPGGWDNLYLEFIAILKALPRKPDPTQIEAAAVQLEVIRTTALNRLKTLMKTEKSSGNAYQNERQLQNSNPESITEFEPCFETKLGEATAVPFNAERMDRSMETGDRPEAAIRKTFPLAVVLKACPGIVDYSPYAQIETWRVLTSTAVTVRAMLGISPSAYQDACDVMGPENAATVIACILERGGHINSPGGYLRDLTERSRRGEFALGPMVMALLRANTQPLRQTG